MYNDIAVLHIILNKLKYVEVTIDASCMAHRFSEISPSLQFPTYSFFYLNFFDGSKSKGISDSEGNIHMNS